MLCVNFHVIGYCSTLAEFEDKLRTAADICAEGESDIVLMACVHCTSQATLDEIIDYNYKSRKVTKLFTNVFNAEGSSGHVGDESRLKEKLARKKRRKLKEQARASAKTVGDVNQQKTQQKTQQQQKYGMPLTPVVESKKTTEALEHPGDDEDVYAMKADPKKNIIKETANILNSIGTAPKPVVVEEEPVVSSDESDDDDSTLSSDEDILGNIRRSAWDYATALDEEDVTSHRRVVCIPENLVMSK
ncbi:unnamed protein product, partial [Symbiodinium microadriaticum]